MKKKLLIPILCLVILLVSVLTLSSCLPLLGWIINNNTATTSSVESNDIQNPDGSYREPINYTDTFLIVDALFKNFSIFDVDY